MTCRSGAFTCGRSPSTMRTALDFGVDKTHAEAMGS